MILPHNIRSAVSAATSAATTAGVLEAVTESVAQGESPTPDPPTYTFTITPAWFTYDAGPENGGLQITESVANWSGGTYWLFQDEFYDARLALLALGASYSPGTYVADLAEFITALGAALDTPDAGLDATITGDSSEIFTVTFTAPPVIGGIPVVYLTYYSESGSSPAFTNPASLVES